MSLSKCRRLTGCVTSYLSPYFKFQKAVRTPSLWAARSTRAFDRVVVALCFAREPLDLSDNVDSGSVHDSFPEAGVPEPSESDTNWFQRERSPIAWLTNSSDQREIFEIDVDDPLESEKSFCLDSSVWLSKRLSDGKSSEVTYHRLLPGQQLQFDEAMTKGVVTSFGCKTQFVASRKKRN